MLAHGGDRRRALELFNHVLRRGHVPKLRATLISEQVLSRKLATGGDALRRQDYDEYFQIMERASRLAPMARCTAQSTASTAWGSRDYPAQT